jgi:hypothetical protein
VAGLSGMVYFFSILFGLSLLLEKRLIEVPS